MQPLNLPEYDFKLKEDEGKTCILDEVRKKYVVLTPEEWVRQNFLQYLIREKGYPGSLIQVEAFTKTGGLNLRADIIARNPQGDPLLIVECKAPGVNITQEVFDQAARYNMKWRSPYLIVTNGLKHFCCAIDHEHQKIRFLKDVPEYANT